MPKEPHQPHQPLRAYIVAIRGSILRTDAFGQQLVKLIYRESRAGAPGLFRRVRGVADAVMTAGGTLADARSWTFQAIRWWRTGQAVEQKYARFEVDPGTSRAMAALLDLLQSLPDNLLQAQAVGKPLQPRRPLSSIFGGASKPGTPAPAAPAKPGTPAAPARPSGTPFGGSAPAAPAPRGNPFGGTTPATPPGSPPRTPFGQPAPASPPPARPVFGASPPANPPAGAQPNAQPGPFGRLFGSRTPAETIPFHIAACFDALATKPGLPAEPPGSVFGDDDDDDSNGIPDWLQASGDAPNSASAAGPTDPLPTDFRALLERLHRDASADKDTTPILRELGKFDDMRVIEHVYKLPPESVDVSKLIEIFKTLGGNVGSAGLISLLPIDQQRRDDWLEALLAVAYRAAASGPSLNEASRHVIWQIAASECDPALDLCPAAFYLLAETGLPDAFQFLWERTHDDDANRRRAAYFALASGDPGARLEELLAGLTSLSDNLAPVTVSSPFSPPARPEPLFVGIPFDRLEAVVTGPKAGLRHYALYLLSYLDDPRVVPFLISQLSRRIPRLRELALAYLRRIRGTSAADAVARLMDKDAALRQRAAAILHEWEDGRCVPVLLDSIVNTPNAASVEPHQVIERLGKYAHPVLNAWLLQTVKTLNEHPTDSEEQMVKLIATILHPANGALHHLRPLAEVVRESSSMKVQLMIINALSKNDEPWARAMLRSFVFDSLPVIVYRAVAVCKDREMARELLTSRQELKRVQGVHILWTARDRDSLLACLSDRSAAVRNLALWALGDLQAPAAVEPLRRLVETHDRIDCWNQNPAVTAWAGLAKMNALAP